MTPATAEATHTGTMSEMNEKGDAKIMWNKDEPAEVEVARAAFDKLTGYHRYAAFHVKGREGKPAGPMAEFDADAERIILVPQLAGG